MLFQRIVVFFIDICSHVAWLSWFAKLFGVLFLSVIQGFAALGCTQNEYIQSNAGSGCIGLHCKYTYAVLCCAVLFVFLKRLKIMKFTNWLEKAAASFSYSCINRLIGALSKRAELQTVNEQVDSTVSFAKFSI